MFPSAGLAPLQGLNSIRELLLGMSGAGNRPNLDDLLSRRQMAEDSMVDWSPKLGGLLPLPVGSHRLTATEGRMLDNLTVQRGLLGLNEFRGIQEQALSVASTRIGDGIVDGHGDAFRHAFWSARLTQAFGAEWARAFTSAHEANPGNTAGAEAMDLHNNSVGIRIGQANPGASEAELSHLIEAALNDGEMVVINRAGNLAWSDDVARGATGRDRLAPMSGGQALPDAYAPVRSY